MEDDTKQDGARLYGQPDDTPEADAENGLRGEGGATGEATTRRTVTMNGHEVEIEEETGSQ